MSGPLGRHIVQYYEHDAFLVDQLAAYFTGPLHAGAAGVVITTPMHQALLEARLQADGVPAGAIQFLDAHATLAKFMVAGSPDPVLFQNTIRSVLAAARRAGNGHVAAFGEMVAILWSEGNSGAALSLEQLWEEILRHEAFDLFCAYPMNVFNGDHTGRLFEQASDSHSEVRPTEAFVALVLESDLRREVARLQQRESVLKSEIARRSAAERDLEQAAREKDHFLAMLGHELRNPLTPMLLNVELARRSAGQNPHLDRIERQATLLKRLVDDLVDMSRLAHGKIALQRDLVPLDTAVSRGAELAQAALEERDHELSVSLPADCFLDADPDRLAQVFGNLLKNAARYTPPGGTIRVEGQRLADAVEVEVSDNGEGFDQERVQRLFDPYVQADPSRGGLGLGLTIVRALVELHQGTVRASSPGPGKGSTFTVRLPLPLVQVKPREEADVPAREPPRRVMVVDDNSDIASTVADVLRLQGHEACSETDSAKAIELATQWRPDVVLCDLSMPGMDGFEVARRLRATPGLERCVLVALSGHTQDADQRAALAAGFDMHIAKPVSAPDLLRAVMVQRQAP